MTEIEFPNSLALMRLVPDGDGPALFEKTEILLPNRNVHGGVSEVFPAMEIAFVWTPPDFEMDFHPASRRRIIVVLDGQMEIEDGHGDSRIFATGDMIDIQDTTGKGHKTRVVGGREVHTALIEIGGKIRPDWTLLEESRRRKVSVTRTMAGEDGASHFVDDTLCYDYDAPLGKATAPRPLVGYQIGFTPGSLDHNFHTASQKQYVLNLSSGMQVETSDSKTRDIHPGDIYLDADTTGQGHMTRALDGKTGLSIFAHLME